MSKQTKIMSVLCLLAFCSAGLADELLVPAEYLTIQAAIYAAVNGDTVIVADGTYTGLGNRDIDFLGKAITVRSESGPENCIIDCNGTEAEPHRGFNFLYGEGPNSVLAGVTITNGYGPRYKGYTVGGAILCDGSSPTITNCAFSGNSADWGGGIYCEFYSSPKISNCTISGNSAGWGAGIYCYDSSPTISNCTISGNSARFGGGIYCWESSPTIKNCTITGNRSLSGGGIYCQDSNVVITNCTISGNTAGNDGGGIYCRYNSSLIITNCTISGNNAADGDGGGIFCYANSSPTISNCSISSNSAYEGGGIYCSSEMSVVNSIVWGNTADFAQEVSTRGDLTFSYCDVKGSGGSGPGWNWDFGTDAGGNIDEEPYFAFATDYHLMPDSTCIDAGDPNYITEPNETDLEGKPRIIGGRIDMGAYEYDPNSPPAIAVSASAVSFYCVKDWSKPAPQTLLIRNCGTGTLGWEIVADCNWLEITPTNGISTGQINEVIITVDPNALAPALYSYDFKVQDPNASNSPVTVQVLLRVGALLRVPQHFLTIQAAIDAARDFDVVLVADGNYTGPGNRDIDFLGKAITVRSESGPENCIIDCNGTWTEPHRGFYFQNNENADSVLDGFTITNGYAPGDKGGGIFCDYSNPTITGCKIEGNYAKYKGGGMYNNYSNPSVNDCTFSGNSVYGEGGGMFNYHSNLTVTNCTFIDGSAMHGGGMHNWASSPIVTNCLFSGNSTSGAAGGMFNRDGGSPTVRNCKFIGNSAGSTGGGMFNFDGSNSVVVNCLFSGNSANGEGGGMYNCSHYNGPAIYPTVVNCTFSGNFALMDGGGIYDRRQANPILVNCILWGNSDSSGMDESAQIHKSDHGAPVVNYCCVQGWTGMLEGRGNIGADPAFVYPATGNYHLLPNSPCIDAGDPNYVPEPNETDIDGNPRVINGRIDMGAYEFNPPVEAAMKLTPQTLNCASKGKYIKAHFVLPEGFRVEDIDANTPATMEPFGIESEYMNVFVNEEDLVEIEIAFGRAALCGAGINYGPAEVTVIGRLTSEQDFYGTDTIRIINNNLKYLGVLSFYWLEVDCGAPDWCGGADVDHSSMVNFIDFALFDGCCIEVVKE